MEHNAVKTPQPKTERHPQNILASAVDAEIEMEYAKARRC